MCRVSKQYHSHWKWRKARLGDDRVANVVTSMGKQFKLKRIFTGCLLLILTKNVLMKSEVLKHSNSCISLIYDFRANEDILFTSPNLLHDLLKQRLALHTFRNLSNIRYLPTSFKVLLVRSNGLPNV